jgi:hypothetical protein
VKADSSLAEIYIEFKWSHGDDPFSDVHNVPCSHCPGNKIVKCFLGDSKTAADTLGQITSYAAVQLSAQFRTHIFSIFIMKDKARII